MSPPLSYARLHRGLVELDAFDVKACVTWLAAHCRISNTCAMPIPDASEGPGDARLITSILMGGGLCVDCIIKKTNLPARRVYEALVTIAQTLNLESGRLLCPDCMITKHVYKLP
jgi:hypothetical protein